ncbi:MAG: hypothetical protein RR998_03820 [Oscillospiraceae bacterium]
MDECSFKFTDNDAKIERERKPRSKKCGGVLGAQLMLSAVVLAVLALIWWLAPNMFAGLVTDYEKLTREPPLFSLDEAAKTVYAVVLELLSSGKGA